MRVTPCLISSHTIKALFDIGARSPEDYEEALKGQTKTPPAFSTFGTPLTQGAGAPQDQRIGFVAVGFNVCGDAPENPSEDEELQHAMWNCLEVMVLTWTDVEILLEIDGIELEIMSPQLPCFRLKSGTCFHLDRGAENERDPCHSMEDLIVDTSTFRQDHPEYIERIEDMHVLGQESQPLV